MEAYDSKLTDEIFNIFKEHDFGLAGFAPEERFAGAPEGHKPKDLLPSATGVIVGAIKQIDSVVDRLPESRFSYSQQHHILNTKQDTVGLSVSRYLQKNGYESVHIPSEGFHEARLFLGYFSHRHAARAAGLGDIGINNLFVTPQYGARVRIMSIITNAPLVPSPTLDENPCKQFQHICKKSCVTMCPAGAIDKDGTLTKTKCKYFLYITFGSQYLQGNYMFSLDRPSLLCGMCVKACRGWELSKQ